MRITFAELRRKTTHSPTAAGRAADDISITQNTTKTLDFTIVVIAIAGCDQFQQADFVRKHTRRPA